jgi:putative phosphoribosyl transferase
MLDKVICQTVAWLRKYLLAKASRERSLADINDRFLNRRDAGRQLANALMRFAESVPFILVLPRGGVPVAFEVP